MSSSQVQTVQELAITGHINNGLCRGAFKILFENKQDHPIETSFTFPLSYGVCVTNFKMIFNGHKYVSRIKRSSEVNMEYDDTVAQGDFAATASINEKNEIRIDIGTLGTNEKCRVNIYFAIGLSPLENGYLLVLPISNIDVSEGLRTGFDETPVKIKFDVKDSVKIQEIKTPFHETKIDLEKGLITADHITLFNPLHIVIKLESKFIGKCLVQQEKDDLFLRIVSPIPRTIRDHPSQFTIMLEKGFLLTDSQISLIIRSIEFFVLSLPNECKFNMCFYGSSFNKLFNEPMILDNVNKEKVFDFLHKSTCSNLKNEFKESYEEMIKNINTEMESIIIIIGSKFSKDVKINDKHKHFFIDPISKGDSQEFSIQNNGYYIQIPDESSIISSLINIIKMTSTKPLEDGILVINEKEISLPPFLPGSMISSYLSIKNVEDIKKVVILYSNIEIELPIIKTDLLILHYLWAHEKIKTSTEEEANKLAIEAQILSPNSSSIIVIERESEIEGDVSHVDSKLSKIGIGWIKDEDENNNDNEDTPVIHPIHPIPLPIRPPRPFPIPLPIIMPRPRPIPYARAQLNDQTLKANGDIINLPNPGTRKEKKQTTNSKVFIGEMNSKSQKEITPIKIKPRDFIEKPREIPVNSKNQRPFFLLRVMQLQNYDGSWSNERNLASSCGYQIPKESSGVDRIPFLTAFVIACIRKRAPNEYDKWGLVVEKALLYLTEKYPNTDWDKIIEDINRTYMN